MSINGMGNTGRRVLRPVVLGIVAAFCVALALPASAYAACGPVALDPGHGGTEAGATGNGLKEEVLNWKIANYCKERLDQLGIPNFLTKQNYETLSRFERNQRAVAKNARALVSFHINSGGGQGAEVLITNTSSWNRFTNTESSSFGRTLLPRLSAAPFNLYNRGLKINNWQGVTYPDGSQADSMGINYYPRLTGTTGLIIEHAFIDNLGDAAKLKSESFLKQLGYADAEAIARQWPNSYTKPAASVVTKNGWRTEGGQRYYYKDGKKLTGWITVGGQRYWMRTTSVNGPVGSMGTGWLTDGGKRYFLDHASGAMRTGWLTDGGKRYYLDPSTGAAATGVRKIDGKTCVFDGQGAQYVNCWLDGSYNPSNNTVPGSKVHYIDANGNEAYTRTTNTPIMGSSTMSKDKFVANFAKLIAPNYPSIYRSDAKYGATTPEAFATATWDAAVKEGVRPEVLAAQVGNETGWLKFGGIVNANQCNFGGIGALDGNANGNAATFPNVQTGLLAQAQHLKAYASKAALNQACVDPRFKYVTRGIAPNVEDLGAGNWASSKLYGRDLLSAMKSIQG